MKEKFTHFKSRIKKFASTKKYSIPTAIVLVVILIVLNTRGGGEAPYTTREAQITTVSQLVSVTGTVKSARAADLSFERGGRVAALKVNVGDKVTEGAELASVANSDLRADLEAELVNLEREKIELAALAGTGGSGRGSGELRSAETALESARLSLIQETNTAAVKMDDAVRNYADRLFENRGDSLTFGVEVVSDGVTYSIGASDSATRARIQRARRDIEELLESFEAVSSNASLQAAKEEGREMEKNLILTQTMLSEIAAVINAREASDAAAQTLYTEYRAAISTARTAIASTIASLRSELEAVQAAETALHVAEEPGSADEIAIQKLSVEQAEAAIAGIRAEIAKTMIVAPVSGTITKVDVEIGETVSSNIPVISVIAESELEIEVNIPEADIAKVRPGAEADVTFDAYGSDFMVVARVVSIDPAETIIDGVPTYRAILSLPGGDERIKSGMTANVDIRGERKDNVIAVPQRAIITRSGERIVRVLENGVPVERKVRAGLRGSDGLTEIIEGVSPGELVVTSSVSDED